MKPELPYNKCQQELQDLLKSRYPLIFLRTSEESRAIRCVIDAHLAILNTGDIQDGELAQWSSTEGFQQRLEIPTSANQAEWKRMGNALDTTGNPILQSLDILQSRLQDQVSKNSSKQHTYLLPDWSVLLRPDDYFIARRLKELIVAIDQKRPVVRMSLVIIGADWTIPTILRNIVHIIDLPLPVEEELYDNVFSVAVEKYGLAEADAW
ncbi:MAG: AAA family ATPase, partial [Sphaerospermopsis kisseleviana]